MTDVETSRKVAGSSLTAVDLSGLTKVELGFALVLAAAATGLVLALGNVERRRTFAIASALGAKARAIGGFVWSEAAFVAMGGIALGAVGAAVLAEMLVKVLMAQAMGIPVPLVLTGVFAPPPASLSVPWGYLAALAAVALGAVVIASTVTIRSARRPALTVLRDL